jgi:hypothetical protein
MGILHEVTEIGLLLAMVVGAVLAYFRFRGRNFGVSDLLIFGALAIGSDIVCYKLFQVVAGGSHADSAAYGALAAMLVLFGLAPVAAGVTMVAFVALLVCLARYPAVRYGTLAAALAAWLAHLFVGNMGAMSAPGGALNSDKLAGENWALESGAASPADCDRQSSAKAFREGCYARLKQ